VAVVVAQKLWVDQVVQVAVAVTVTGLAVREPPTKAILVVHVLVVAQLSTGAGVELVLWVVPVLSQ